MEIVRPIYKKALMAAVAIYVIGTALLLADLYNTVGRLEHEMIHASGKCPSASHK